MWLRANAPPRQIEAYEKLRRFVEQFRKIPLTDYDADAASRFEQLRQARVRIGTMDLRIASVCLAHDATLLTRKLSDFNKVPGMRAEDWSA